MDQPDKFEHRRLRMLELVTALGTSRAVIAKRMGIADSYLTRILYKQGENKQARRISDESIAKAQTAFSLAPGWFDLPLGHRLPPPIPAPDGATAPPPISFAAHAERRAAQDVEGTASNDPWWPFNLDPERLRALLTPNDIVRIEAYIRGILDSREAEGGHDKSSGAGN